jgi:Putative peptidoglycan binding domain
VKEKEIEMSTTYTSPGGSTQSSSVRAAVVAVFVVAVVAIVAIAGFAFGRHADAQSAPAPTAHTAVVIHHLPAHSTSAVTLQEQLAQLRLYNGAIDGIIGPETRAAISSVQREAGLPQTGRMNAATHNALDYYLANDLPGSG